MCAQCAASVRCFVLLVFGAALCLVPSSALAQQPLPDDAAAALEKALRPGDRVTVSLPGDVTIKGRFVQLSPDLFTVQTPDGRRDLALRDIGRVRRTRTGFLLGTIIGAGIGAGLGAAAASYAENEAGNGATAFLTIFGIGLAAGAGIDALVNFPRTVYVRDHRVSIAPIVTPGAVGGTVRMTF